MAIDYNKLMDQLDKCLGLEVSATESVKQKSPTKSIIKSKAKKAFEGYDEVERDLANELDEVQDSVIDDEFIFNEEVESEAEEGEAPTDEECLATCAKNIATKLLDEGQDYEEVEEVLEEMVESAIAEFKPGDQVDAKESFKGRKCHRGRKATESEENDRLRKEFIRISGLVGEDSEEKEREELKRRLASGTYKGSVELKEIVETGSNFKRFTDWVRMVDDWVEESDDTDHHYHIGMEYFFDDDTDYLRFATLGGNEGREGQASNKEEYLSNLEDLGYLSEKSSAQWKKIMNRMAELYDKLSYKEVKEALRMFWYDDEDPDEEDDEAYESFKGRKCHRGRKATESSHKPKKKIEEDRVEVSSSTEGKGCKSVEDGCENPEDAFESLKAKMLDRYATLSKVYSNKKNSSATEGKTGKEVVIAEEALSRTSAEFGYSGRNLRKIVEEAIKKGVI